MLIKKKPEQANIKPSEQKEKPKRTMASLRLQKDLTQYKQQQISFVKLSFPSQDSLQLIVVDILVQQNSIYANCNITFQLDFPETYPIDPPRLKCLNKIYHPNISYKGNVCLPLVRQDFAPTVTLTSIICGLIYILTYPNAEDALLPQIGDLMIKDYEMFKRIVQHTVEGRVFKNLQYDPIFVRNLDLKQMKDLRDNIKEQNQPVMKKIYSEQPRSKEKIQNQPNKNTDWNEKRQQCQEK